MSIVNPFSRRDLFKFSALASTLALPFTFKTAHANESQPGVSDEFQFEVVRSEEEWREILTRREFNILRKGGTEPQRSSELWNEESKGHYHCKGCDLYIYSSEQKEVLDRGWLFFFHSEPNSVLTGIDPGGDHGVIEARCRRCGSHLGHILFVEDYVRHCINGISLVFYPEA
ncbi:MAG: peptide-methionine (R)-S-oxide reductase [Synechococcaceae cyanobacterium SM2_3_1]|nr:peptide-methionine (R)-S-oxide reductase [Synechococcaceae cyanobacterium SM2_3_1]